VVKYILALLLLPAVSHAGYFVEKSMYVTTYLAVGTGTTLEIAKRDARDAIPAPNKWITFEPNSNQFSPQYQCVGGERWSEKDECSGGEIQYFLPLRRVEQ
jgi:hypothetical protein